MQTETTATSGFRPSISGVWDLPPLILHPFAERDGADKLIEGSRAAMMLRGLIPGDVDADELVRRILAGRYNEVRMLYFLGKDIVRWLEQCQEMAARVEKLRALDLQSASFAALLVDRPPATVSEKLIRWGVTDQRTIFSRAIGLRSAFEELPPVELLTPLFLKNYHRYADHLYTAYQRIAEPATIGCENFRFEIYGSEEYSRKLEAEFDRGV